MEPYPQEAIFLKIPKLVLSGSIAGAVNGLLGAGGGMILVPLLNASGQLEQRQVFSSSVAMILPLCLVSLVVTGLGNGLPWAEALPYLIGSIPGGLLAGIWGRCIPTGLLHRTLGLIIVWGGIRYLWP